MSTALRRWLPRTRLHDHREPASGVSCAGVGITTILCTPAEVGFLIYHTTLAAELYQFFLSSHWYNSCINFSKGPYGRVLIGAAVIGHHFLTNERNLSFQLTPRSPCLEIIFFFASIFAQLKTQLTNNKHNTAHHAQESNKRLCRRSSRSSSVLQ